VNTSAFTDPGSRGFHKRPGGETQPGWETSILGDRRSGDFGSVDANSPGQREEFPTGTMGAGGSEWVLMPALGSVTLARDHVEGDRRPEGR
jgi:hypothetical protein